MTSAALPSTSVRDRPIPLRMRPDLIVRRDLSGSEPLWIIKDPLTLDFFHLREREYRLLCLLDGHRSLGAIKSEFERIFNGDRLSPRRFHVFCLSMQRDGLLLSPTEDPRQLIERRQKQRRSQRTERWANPLAIRFRGVDPAPLMDAIYPIVRPLLSTPAVLAGLTASLLVYLFVLVRFDLFRAQLPAIETLFTGTNLLLLAVAIGVTKVLHELAHAFCCKHFGGECREIGAMLLVFTPCLYCDVSDAYLIPSRWRRMAIGAAGMFADSLLAAVCLVLWWFCREETLKLFLLHMVIVSTVATVLFNANPLLRFDGYYILADWLGVPNLWTRSRSLLESQLKRLCLGVVEPSETNLPLATRAAMLCYAVGSIAYRWIVIFAIAAMFIAVAKPYGLDWLAYVAIVWMVAASAISPLWSLKRTISDPIARQRVKRTRLAIASLLIVISIAGLMLVPLPHRTRAEAVIRLREVAHVYATHDGVLRETIDYGTQVTAGEAIAQLDNATLALRYLELSGQRDRLQSRVDALLTLRAADPTVAADIPPAAESLRDYENRLTELARQRERLVIQAERGGTFYPPESNEEESQAMDGIIADAPPLSDALIGRAVTVGEQLGRIGDPRDLYAELTLDTDRIEFIRPSQKVRLRLNESPARVIEGEVIDISPASGGLGEPDEADEYRVRVEFELPDEEITVGARGIATVWNEPRSISNRMLRTFSRLFALGR